MEKWMVYAKKADFQEIGRKFGIDPVIARLIRNRDVDGDEAIQSYLHGTLEELPSPWFMKDMDKAVEILRMKIAENKKIRIIGDYDIDGVTATCILLKGLKRLKNPSSGRGLNVVSGQIIEKESVGNLSHGNK